MSRTQLMNMTVQVIDWSDLIRTALYKFKEKFNSRIGLFLAAADEHLGHRKRNIRRDIAYRAHNRYRKLMNKPRAVAATPVWLRKYLANLFGLDMPKTVVSRSRKRLSNKAIPRTGAQIHRR
jgi:hypothetical protein